MKYFALLLVFTLTSLAFAAKPNIVVIMADDMGYADAGFTGSSDIQTPNLDALAASGVTFTHGYANHPFCGPSRAALLSGRYQHRFGFETNPAYDPANPIMGIDRGERLFPKRLQAAGYFTACVGKWHLGAAQPFHPNNRGFDYFYGMLGGGHDYFRIDMTKPVKEGYLQGLVRNDRPADFDGYLTTALSRDAANFISSQNTEKPFFLYVAYNAPHAPLQAPKEDIERYAHIPDKKRRTYAAMVDVMDRGIGEILSALDKQGMRDNTLVFFTSDNGGPQSTKQQPGKWNGSSNAPFRGGKGDLFDGGVHVPFVASWPARIKPGQVFESQVIHLDIARTAVEVAGADATAKPAMEGVDLMPFLSGQQEGAPHKALFWRNGDGGKQWSILAEDGTKHMYNKYSGKTSLFYLLDDVGEANDVISGQPDRAKELRAEWEKWDEGNQPCRLMGYIDYHKKRDGFYSEAIPKDAGVKGYVPEVPGSFKGR